ncbi:MAG: NADH-quinone oxidoreductase subunit J [Chloroflexota bacterium]|nr:NADH-quinone oxidoreductase subunit J [Chloroflexota bacterium]MDE3100776.1 NADH-quinone oxidoreductase subunit J [Chloroflexota bacterium]
MDVLGPILFAFLTLMIVGGGLGVVLAGRITTSALLMAFTFLNMAGMFVLLGSETIAAFQVLIYVGAITVLILYGVMFTPQTPRAYGLFFQKQTPWGALVAALAALPVIVVAFSFHDAASLPAPGGDLNALATAVFTSFAFPFEVASVLLLSAMVGAIVLVKREPASRPPAAPPDPERPV